MHRKLRSSAVHIIGFCPRETRISGFRPTGRKKLLGFLNMPRHRQPRTGRGVSQRQLRVGELVRHVLADMLARGEVHDPVIQSHLITIPEVRMTADLRLATIYAMPLGGHDIDAVLAALNRNSRFLRGEIARRVNLKFAPDIRFAIDERFDEAERIEKLLRTPAVQRDLHNKSDDQS
jgi:ribosome-binding factor A